MTELLERRVLGALRFLDATTGARIVEPLAVRAKGVRFVRNMSGHYVIFDAPGLAAHTYAFLAPPAAPPTGSLSFTVEVSDPAGRYLPRLRTVRLPRDPDPTHHNSPDSLFNAVNVALFPAPAASMRPAWGVVRGSVVEVATARPLGGALLLVERTSDSALLARGLSDARGEAVVAVPAIPVMTFAEGEDADSGAGAGPVTETEVAVSLTAVFDPAAGAVADPDDLEDRRDSLPSVSFGGRLSSGRVLAATFAVSLP